MRRNVRGTAGDVQMSVRINYIGRFGNNLFQYTFARLFAVQHGLRLLTPLVPNPLVEPSPHEDGYRITAPDVKIEDEGEDLLEARRLPACYTINGFFQYAKLYHARRRQVEGFYKVAPIPELNTRDIVAHVRTVEYISWKWAVHPTWYLDILSRERFD